jgi:hypothetical protein
MTAAARKTHRPQRHRGAPKELPLDELVRALLPRLAPRLVPLVLSEIAKLAANAGAPYSTRRGCAPPGWTDDGWRAVAESVPGTLRPVGANGKPGRWLVTPRAAYDAWIARQGAQPFAAGGLPVLPSAATAREPWHPRMAAEALGLRLVRRPR